MTVSGLTMMRAERQLDHTRESQTPDASVAWFEDHPLRFLGSLQHDQLMTQGDDLGLHSGASPKAKKEGIQKHQYKVERSGKKATRLGRNSNNSNADVIFRKDSRCPAPSRQSQTIF